MKKYYLVIIVLFCFSLSYAQKNKNTVVLKNGTIIKGEIVEIIPNEGVKIKSGEHLFHLKNSEIQSINLDGKNNGSVETDKKEYSGIFNKTSLGILAGSSSSEQKAPFVFTSSLGYHISPKFTAGIGTGLEFYKEILLPAYGEFQYFFNQNKIAPYVYGHGGWAFAIDDRKSNTTETYDSKGGIRYGGGVGVKLWSNNGFGFVMEAGYQFQEIEVGKSSNHVMYNSTLYDEYNRFAVKIGFYFN